jgi:hypothetical protein
MNTKKISELEQLEVLSDDTNVLLEYGGSTKRFPASKLGVVKTVNGNVPDAEGNVEINIPECKVKTVNNVEPDENGNVNVEIPEVPVKSVNGQTGEVQIEIPEVPDSIAPPESAAVGQTIVVEEVDENCKPTKWKSTDFPKADQSDWNAKEGELGYVLNRTHYVETGEIVMPETTLENMDGTFTCVYEWEMLVNGEVYEVTYNGKKHLCTTKMGADGLYFGFNPQSGKDKHIPFFGAFMDGMLWFMPFDGAESVTLSISKVTIHPIAEHLLSNGRYEVDYTSLELDGGKNSARNYDDIAAALQSGRTVVLTTYTEASVIEFTVIGWTWHAGLGLTICYSYLDTISKINFTNGTWTPNT